MTTSTTSDVYYDPYDVDIYADPYPVFRRLREEAPLYYQRTLRLLRPQPVRGRREGPGRPRHLQLGARRHPRGDQGEHRVAVRVSSSSRTRRSTVPPRPALPGVHPEEDERARAADTRVLRRGLDPLVGADGFDFVADLGAQMPMRVIGMLLGIPEQDQEAIRDRADKDPSRTGRADPGLSPRTTFADDDFLRRLHRLAGLAPLGRPHDRAARGRVRGRDRHRPTPHPRGDPDLRQRPRHAGNETTNRLIGWTGKVLADHPDQRRELVEDRSLIPNAIEEVLRYEPPSLHDGRYVTRDVELLRPNGAGGQRHDVPGGSANRDHRRFPPTAISSTSTARSATTSPSATGSTSAWVPRWPASRAHRPRRGAEPLSGLGGGQRPRRTRFIGGTGWKTLPVLTS